MLMLVLSDKVNLDDFLARLRTSTNRILMLDYDGTLAPFTTERDKAFPYPDVSAVLDDLVSCRITRTIIISGRPVDTLKPLLRTRNVPELWGCHGLERLKPDGSYSIGETESRTREGFREIEKWAEENDLTQYTERKPSGIAFHWRGLSARRANQMENQVSVKWSQTAETFGLSLHRFDGGLELRVSSVNKGMAVSRIIRESTPGSVIAYVGDDATDEDAFDALGGFGLSVLVGNSARKTSADILLRPPEDLVDFLRLWV